MPRTCFIASPAASDAMQAALARVNVAVVAADLANAKLKPLLKRAEAAGVDSEKVAAIMRKTEKDAEKTILYREKKDKVKKELLIPLVLEAELTLGGTDRSAAEEYMSEKIWNAYLQAQDKKQSKELQAQAKRGRESLKKMGVGGGLQARLAFQKQMGAALESSMKSKLSGELPADEQLLLDRAFMHPKPSTKPGDGGGKWFVVMFQ